MERTIKPSALLRLPPPNFETLPTAPKTKFATSIMPLMAPVILGRNEFKSLTTLVIPLFNPPTGSVVVLINVPMRRLLTPPEIPETAFVIPEIPLRAESVLVTPEVTLLLILLSYFRN